MGVAICDQSAGVPLRPTDQPTDRPAAIEVELVRRLAAGDHGAMGEVYRRHSGAVLGAVSRVLFDRARCEDVVQDVFITLWRRPDRFDPERGCLRTFLMTVARTRAIDVRRSDQARDLREVRRSRDGSHPGPAADVEGAVLRAAMAEEVQAALAALPHRTRAPIELAFYGARTYTQVAAELGLPEGTVKSQIRSGLRQLALTLDDARGR